MVVGFTFVIVAWLIVFVAEICKSNGLYRGTSVFRVLTLLYVVAFIVYGLTDPTQFFAVMGMRPFKAMLVFGLAGAYSGIMFLLELYLPRKYYPTYLDVPRQVLYKVGKYGKCIVLSEDEAKKAHKNGETVYIHAMARVTYKPKDEAEKEQPKTEAKTVDTAKGLDATGYTLHDQQRKTLEAMLANTPNREQVVDLLGKLKTIQQNRGK